MAVSILASHSVDWNVTLAMGCQNMTDYLGSDIDAGKGRKEAFSIVGTRWTDGTSPSTHPLYLGPRKNKQSL